MKIKRLSLTMLGLTTLGMSAAPAVMAGNLTVANSDMTLAGGVAAAGIYSDGAGIGQGSDTTPTDFLLELSASAKAGGAGFVAGYGSLLEPTVFGGSLNNTAFDNTMKLQYASLTVKPTEAVSIEAGTLATKIGYEVANTYANPNILLGALWNSQPIYYPGVRASYSGDGISGFVETNEDHAMGGANGGIPNYGYVVGASGVAGSVSYAVTYYNADAGRDCFDVIVSGELAGIKVAANIDYHMINKPTTGLDDSALGIALYAMPAVAGISVPVRLEYLDSGTSGVYATADGAGYTLTVTPTYGLGDNTFVRGELAYAMADTKVFDGSTSDTMTSYGVQVGYKF
ncbi:MAG: outer membrane beta-barrel protein [Gammaproteobacteria bacterium]|nr:outer membrane beta-barrel protein [Gammaproteobacteria bacterium]